MAKSSLLDQLWSVKCTMLLVCCDYWTIYVNITLKKYVDNRKHFESRISRRKFFSFVIQRINWTKNPFVIITCLWVIGVTYFRSWDSVYVIIYTTQPMWSRIGSRKSVMESYIVHVQSWPPNTFLVFICSLFPTLFKIETAKSETAFFENLF